MPTLKPAALFWSFAAVAALVFLPLPMVVAQEQIPEALVTPNEFSGTPYFPGTRRNMASGEAPEVYKVEGGDTLFDICDQLIDDPDYWPKLWALNPGIKNPHFIFPGIELSFYPGDEDVPPYLQVVGEADTIPIEKGGLDESELLNVDVSHLMFENIRVEPMQILDLAAVASMPQSEYEEIGSVFDTEQAMIVVPAFLYKEALEPLGACVGGPTGSFLMGLGDEALFSSTAGLNSGSTYTVVRATGNLRQTGIDMDAFRYEFVAHVAVKGSIGENFRVAQVMESRLGIIPGDFIIPYTATTRGYSLQEKNITNSDKDAKVIGFAYATQTMGGQGNLVFLDRALPAGATMPVYQRIDRRAAPGLGISLPEVKKRIGSIQIIDRLKTGSLGIIVKNTLDIRIGDLLGKTSM